MKKLGLILGTFIAVILLILLIVAQNKPKTDAIAIKGLADCSKNIHGDVVADIQTKSHALIKSANNYNKLPTAPNYVSEVRQGSCVQTGKEQAVGYSGRQFTVYSTTIILDIPDAKQSWKLSYNWVQRGPKIDLDLGTIQPECLAKKDLIYGDFNCEKVMSEATYGTDKYDPILKYMPYTGQTFNLSFDPNTKQVNAQIIVLKKDQNNTALIENDKAAVLFWFKHRQLDPKNYTIVYSVITD